MILFLVFIPSVSGELEKEWSKTYGEFGHSEARSVIESSDGGYALAGFTNSFGSGGYDFYLVKVDSSGNEEWSRTYGEDNTDVAYSLVQTSDGEYVIAGWTGSYDPPKSQFYLVKIALTLEQPLPFWLSVTFILVPLLALAVAFFYYRNPKSRS